MRFDKQLGLALVIGVSFWGLDRVLESDVAQAAPAYRAKLLERYAGAVEHCQEDGHCLDMQRLAVMLGE